MRDVVIERARIVQAVGRYRALHKHRRRRVRKKYVGMVVFTTDVVDDLQACMKDLWHLHSLGVRFSPRGERRIVRLLNKAGHHLRAPRDMLECRR